MKLSQKIFIPIAILLAGLVVVFAASYTALYYQQSVINRELESSERVNSIIHELENTERETQISVMAYRQGRDPFDAANVRENEGRIARLVARAKAQTADPSGRELVDRYVAARAGLSDINESLIEAIDVGNDERILSEFGKWSTKVQSTDAALDDLSSYSLTHVNRMADELNTFVRRIFVVFIVIIVSGSLLTVLLVLYFKQNITMPIEALSKAADRLAGRDYDIELGIRSNDELGNLARVFTEMANNMRAYNAMLEGELRKKDEFIGIASHELKTPLTSLKIFTQMLQRIAEEKGDHEYRPHLQRINEQSDKLNNLVASLLDIARLEGGKIMYDKESFDLNSLARSAAEEMGLTSPRHAISVEGFVESPAYGDKERISQVLSNFLSNAIKYSPSGGAIAVELKESGDEAVVSVRDNGIGIDKKHHAKLFERFFRVEDKDQITFPGMGVGLYIASSIVRNHGGRIWVESEKGKGSVFHFTVPLVRG